MPNTNIIFTGAMGVGKTAIVHQLLNQPFNPKYLPTVQPQKTRRQLSGKTLQITDLAGELQQNKIPPSSFLGQDLICYVFDINRPNSFQQLEANLDFLNTNSNGEVLVIANKTDLLAQDQIDRLIASLKVDKILEMSAKDRRGLESLQEKILNI